MLKPVCIVKAVTYPGVGIAVEKYLDSEDVGKPEVPQVVFEELLVNALVHRDYFISAPVRLFIFDDRVEIISPGSLPNNLSVAKISYIVGN